jgi:hypothetical protein
MTEASKPDTPTRVGLSEGLGAPWMAGLAECNDCDNQWSAVWPLGADALECQRCGSTNTDRNSYECY